MPKTYSMASLSRTPSPDINKMDQYKQAAETLSRILKIKGIRHAFMGGFPLYLLGNARIPVDIDVIVDAKVSAILDALEAEEEIILPDSRMVDGVFKIKIPIGEINVRLDIFETSRGLGRGVSLGSTQDIFCKTRKIPVLNFTQFVNTKLKAWCDRDEEKDAKDVYFLVHKAGSHIHKGDLNNKLVEQFCSECPDGLTNDQFNGVKGALQ